MPPSFYLVPFVVGLGWGAVRVWREGERRSLLRLAWPLPAIWLGLAALAILYVLVAGSRGDAGMSGFAVVVFGLMGAVGAMASFFGAMLGGWVMRKGLPKS